MQKRQVPTRNYIIFGVVAMASFITVFNLARWYKNIKEEYENKSIMSETVSSVYENDIDNFITENESFTLYLSDSVDKEVKEFERAFSKLIIKKDISDRIIYLDIKEIEKEAFYNTFVNNYYSDLLKENNINLNVRPNLIHFSDHKVTAVLYSTEKEMDIDLVEQFLVNNEVIEQ